MAISKTDELRPSFTTLATVAGMVVTLIGLLILIGWQYDITVLKTFGVKAASMKPNAAFAFFLAGLALLLLNLKHKNALTQVIPIAFGGIVLLIGLLTTIEYLFHIDFHIDQILFKEVHNAVFTIIPGRMSFNLALGFVFIGIALLLIRKEGELLKGSAFLALAIGIFAILGYVFNLSFFLQLVGVNTIALDSAICLTILSAGIYFTIPKSGFERTKIEQQTIVVFVFVAFFIITTSVIFLNIQERMNELDNHIQNEMHAKEKMEQTFSLVKDLEIGSRGYIITNDEAFLEPFSNAKLKIHDALNELKAVAKDLTANQYVDTLNTLILKRLSFDEGTLSIRKEKGLQAAIERISGGTGNLLMDSISVVVAKMKSVDHDYYENQRDQELRIAYEGKLIQSLIVFLQFGFLITIYFLISRDVTERKKVEAAQLKQREIIEKLNGISALLTEDLTLGQCLDEGLQIILSTSFLKSKNKGGIFLVTPGKNELTLKCSINLSGSIQKLCAHVPFAHCLCGRAAANGEIQYANCIDERHENSYPGMEQHGHYSIPMISDGSVNGVIILYLPDGYPSDIIDMNFLRSAAGLVAAIVIRKQSEESLTASEEKFRTLFESSVEGICLMDKDQKIVLVNPQMEKMFGYTTGEVLNMNLVNFIPEDERANYLTKISERKKGNSEVYEMKLLTKAGLALWVIVSASPVFDKDGKYHGSFGMLTNITELKAAESALQKFYLGVEQSPTSVVITDINGNIEYVNPYFTETTGYSSLEVIGKNPRILKSGHKTKEEVKELWETILAGKSWRGDLLNKKKNGELFWESTTISPIKNEGGEITHFIAIKLDITEKKNLLDDLILSKDRAEESSRLKSSFLSNMSHELRTPLIAILGYSEAITDEAKDETTAEMARIIYKGGKRLLDTLNLILNLSRIEAGRLELQKEEADVASVLDEVIDLFSELAAKKGLYIKKEFTASRTKTKTDKMILGQVFNNLLNNGIKYTSKGGVTVSIENTGGGGDWISISFRDTGIGISTDKQELIWEEFRQASEGYSRGFEGTGLGLTITKKFTEKLGGTISVHSEVGTGSVFTVKIPIVEESALNKIETFKEDKTPVVSSGTHTKSHIPKILLVDNDPVAVNYLKLVLKDSYQIDVCINGLSSIEKAKENKYDLILMDINLGKGMSGTDAVKRIRELSGYKNTPIAAITAHAMDGDREEFISAGCTHYISKPYARNTLLGLLNNILEKKM
jgi:PAS domain S-box-containing protein